MFRTCVQTNAFSEWGKLASRFSTNTMKMRGFNYSLRPATTARSLHEYYAGYVAMSTAEYLKLSAATNQQVATYSTGGRRVPKHY
jgi:hypothetical protein